MPCIATSQDALRHHKMHCDITRWTTMWQFGYAAVLMAVVVLASKSDWLVGCLSPTPLWLWNKWLFSRCLYSKTRPQWAQGKVPPFSVIPSISSVRCFKYTCTPKWCSCWKDFPHSSHLNNFSFSTTCITAAWCVFFMCMFSWREESQDSVHWGHWYGFSAGEVEVLFSWETRWLARCDLTSKLRGQYWQLNTPSSLGSGSLGRDPGSGKRRGEMGRGGAEGRGGGQGRLNCMVINALHTTNAIIRHT